MGPNYDLGKLTHIIVDDKKYIENSENEKKSEASEPSVGLKDTQYNFTKNTINDMG